MQANADENCQIDLSIVIPAFEESSKIGRDIEEAASFLAGNKLAGEIIVVDDGSGDETAEIAKAAVPRQTGVDLKVIRYDEHRGKGYAVRRGIKESHGKFVMFADSGSCVPYASVLQGLEMLKEDRCDAAYGSRKMRQSHIQRPQNWYRRMCSAGFHWFMIFYMKVPAELSDTQCGFKVYKGDVARSLYAKCATDGFMFDVEITMRAQKEGLRIKEFGVEWTCDRDSRLTPARSLWRILAELKAIKRMLAEE